MELEIRRSGSQNNIHSAHGPDALEHQYVDFRETADAAGLLPLVHWIITGGAEFEIFLESIFRI